MNDTPPEIAEKVRESILKKTPQERFKMGCEMYDTSRYLITWAITQENPQITPVELRQQLFLKFYGDEFSPEEKEKILAFFVEREAERTARAKEESSFV